jgi:glycosyltransferase involved in cell wall biosynthesis
VGQSRFAARRRTMHGARIGCGGVILFLHNRYRTTGGEERAVEQLMWLVREQLREPAELLERSSEQQSRVGAALALLRGGTDPAEVARAVRLSGARVVHAHNLHPAFGWRALARARAAGARVVLHLHQYRLVCAIGVCFTRGEDCTRCHARNTLPGIALRCRGSAGEALSYAAALAMWQRRMAEAADAVVVPSAFARERLRELGAPLRWERVHVLAPPVRVSGEPRDRAGDGAYALVASRLSVEKGVDVAIDACRMAGVPLVIAGDGPERPRLEARAAGARVRFTGRVDDAELTRLRAGARVALVPSRGPETFGLAAAEAMAAGLPVAGARAGALPELLDEPALAEPGDPHSLAAAMARVLEDPAAGERGRERVRAVCAPPVVARRLAVVYDGRAAST